MKKIIAIFAALLMLVLPLSLPVSASTPYQTYTYSISGTALHSPDAYIPSKTISAKEMGLTGDEGIDFLAQYYPGLQELCAVRDAARAELAAAEKTLVEVEAAYGTSHKNYQTAEKAVANAEKAIKSAQTKIDTYLGEEGGKWTALNDICGPCDVETDAEQNVYIADTLNNRIVVLDRYYKVKMIIHSFLNDQGIEDSFTKPEGVYITSDRRVGDDWVEGRIYVCDTEGGRIVTFDLDGNFQDVIGEPESELFTSTYRPVAVAVDNYNRLYVISDMTYEGIIVMTEDGEFTGYVGAQKVSISAWEQIWRRFQTKEQRKLQKTYVSTEFNNITLTGDFIYATTSGIEEANVTSAITSKSKTGDYAPVKMLNAAGDEIMRRNGFYPPSGEVDFKQANPSDEFLGGASIIVDVAIGPEKTWSIIDQKRSKVFTYDFDGNLLFAFGDMGRQLGNIAKGGLNAVTYQGSKMLLMEKSSGNSAFTVYDRTEYGNILIQALADQNARRNDQAIYNWREILKRNSNFDAAYIGIGRAMAQDGKYAEAMEMYMAAYDTENYSKAYQEVRKEWITNFIWLIPIIVIAICFGCTKFLGFAKKVNKRVSVTKGKKTFGQELIYVFHVIFHPFDGFWDLKHEKRGSVRAGTTILALVIVAFYYQAIGQGYIMNPQGQYAGVFSVILSVLIPFALWIVANWCLTTLFDGEGSLKDIYIASTYALLPMALIMIPTTIASNFVLVTEASILTLINTFAFIWAGFLLFFGIMVTHDYSMGKNFITTLGTILGMVIIIFIVFLFTVLLADMVNYVTNIVTEIQFRA